ncbi:MAG: exonuclease SbcCD subunit D [Bacillus sp. (in: firmicutes)]
MKVKELTFIHAADLHLDSPFAGLKQVPEHLLTKMRDATFQAFKRVVDEAIQYRVQFILLAGDLYDGENRSLRTQVRVREQLERLVPYGIQVYIIHGNHDHLNGKWVKLEMPEHVHSFQDQYEMKVYEHAGLKAHIYGYSYPVQHVKQRIIDQYKKTGEADYHIGMLHGNLEGSKGHGNYAPFSQADLLDKDMDYWALGHIHARRELSQSPPVVYPGNTQGRHRKEGGPKGCYHVVLKGKESRLTFLQTSEIIWEDVVISSKAEEGFDDLFNRCCTKLDEIRDNRCGKFISVTIGGNGWIGDETELLELLKEREESRPDFVFPYKLKVRDDRKDATTAAPLAHLVKEYEPSVMDVQEALRPLYKHSTGRRFLTELTDEEQFDLIKEAKELLYRQLAYGGDD